MHTTAEYQPMHNYVWLMVETYRLNLWKHKKYKL